MSDEFKMIFWKDWEFIMKKYWDKFAKNDRDECWLIGGAARYHMITCKHKVRLTHRVSFAVFNKVDITDGRVAMHLCDNKRCINPTHIKLGTHSDNSKDAYLKGILPKPPGGSCENSPVSKTAISDVIRIFILRLEGLPQEEIADRVRLSQGHVSEILNLRKWGNLIDDNRPISEVFDGK